MQQQSATTASDPAELIDALPEREWELLQQSLAEVGDSVPRYRDCDEVQKILERIRSSRAAIDRLEHALESSHLACCILPEVSAHAELWHALARLAARGVGGLVVVEGEQSLDDYIARGTPLDAELSASLLESLFHPGGALHDGAVIVRGARVMAAGVFLPLMAEHREPGRGRLIGGRHRAALGLSRLTDALVFVVSEETREISLAVHGQLHAALHFEAPDPLDAVGPDIAARYVSPLERLRSALRSLFRLERQRRARRPPIDAGPW